MQQIKRLFSFTQAFNYSFIHSLISLIAVIFAFEQSTHAFKLIKRLKKPLQFLLFLNKCKTNILFYGFQPVSLVSLSIVLLKKNNKKINKFKIRIL